MTTDEHYMQLAYAQAQLAARREEVPVGAVLVGGEGDVLAQDGNRSIELSDPTAHAEILVLRKAASQLANYRLLATTLYVTLEPCVMCSGALISARVTRLVYGAADPKAGAIVSRYRVGSDGMLNHNITVSAGLMAEECGRLLTEFFKARR
nr:nucleoside deaminase [Desulfobulbaceae bacterium]